MWFTANSFLHWNYKRTPIQLQFHLLSHTNNAICWTARGSRNWDQTCTRYGYVCVCVTVPASLARWLRYVALRLLCVFVVIKSYLLSFGFLNSPGKSFSWFRLFTFIQFERIHLRFMVMDNGKYYGSNNNNNNHFVQVDIYFPLVVLVLDLFSNVPQRRCVRTHYD